MLHARTNVVCSRQLFKTMVAESAGALGLTDSRHRTWSTELALFSLLLLIIAHLCTHSHHALLKLSLTLSQRLYLRANRAQVALKRSTLFLVNSACLTLPLCSSAHFDDHACSLPDSLQAHYLILSQL